MMEELIFGGLLFLVAMLYASVGHGGASGYLALMAIFGMSTVTMKSSALVLNLIVSLVAFIQFYRSGYFRFNAFLPFATASIPFSFLGGMIQVESQIYKISLGIFLFFVVFRMIFFDKIQSSEDKSQPLIVSVIIGASIGFLSGLLGIGGGIILSPVLVLLYSMHQKKAAAISALFIFANSFAGLLGQWTKGVSIDPKIYIYVILAFVGGLVGSYLGAYKIKQNVLKYVLSLVLSIAIFKLFTQ